MFFFRAALNFTRTPSSPTQTPPPLPQYLGAQYEKLDSVEKSTGYHKVYFVALLAVAAALLVVLVGGFNLVVNLVGFFTPAWASFKAIESKQKDDDTQWLTYWVVFASFSIVEQVAGFLTRWIPFYQVLKLAFLVWCYHPSTCGASKVYNNVIKVFVFPYIGLGDLAPAAKKVE